VKRYVNLMLMMIAAAVPVSGFAADRGAFFESYCIDCHGPYAQEAGLRLDRLDDDLGDVDTFAQWVRIHDRLDRGEMPPEDMPQPEAAERDAVVQALKRDLLAAERKRQQEEGSGLVRRMNRTEYEHTLQDLLALPLLRVKQSLPEDGRQPGFDKVPGALELSHIQMKKYLETADKALRQAVVRQVEPPQAQVWRQPAAEQWSGRAAIATHNAAPVTGGKLAPGLKTIVRGNPVDDPGNTYRAAAFNGEADSLVVFSGRLGAHQPQGVQPDRFQPKIGGWYRVRFRIWALRWERDTVKPAVRGKIRKYIEFGEPWKRDDEQRWKGTPLVEERVQELEENVEFYGDAEAVHVVRASLKGKPLGYFDAPSLKPTTHELKVWLEPDERVSFHVMSLPSNGPRNSASSDGVRSYEGPAVAFDWFEIEGPLFESWPPESQQRLFGTTPIGQFPRPLPAGLPTAAPGKSTAVSVDSLQGAGQHVGDLWYLNVAGKASTRVNFAAPGEYEISVAAAETPAGDEPAKMRLLLDGRPISGGTFAVAAPRGEAKRFVQSIDIPSAGPAEIGIEFLNDFFDEQTRADRNLLISAIEVKGPKEAREVEIASRTAPDFRSLLQEFADRAFRRPVKPDEVEPYAAIVEEQLEMGESFEEAMLAGYKAILCSPDFLFLGLEDENPATADDGEKPAYALASRLSYFLWNSLPDEELRQLAESGELAKPKVLLAQVERMLADPRSDRFVQHFLDQWLELEDIDFTMPDPQLYPEFDRWLRDSMLAETRAYFRKLITEDRSIDHVIDSDFVLVNQRLAELYNIRGVAGGRLQEVAIDEENPRGGLLGQAAVLKVTANGTATSPVLRGVWVTERILGVPIKPPPPNIPAIEPDASGAVTIREQIEKHRADSVCASCHKVMDPPGLALESFDVIGRFREHYRASGRPKRVGKGKDRMLEPHISVITDSGRRTLVRLGGEVDPSGVLPDGRRFANVNEFRELLLDNKRQLAQNLARQLTIYATGRGHRFADREAIDAIVAQAKSADYGVRTLVENVVLSPLFTQTD